MVVSKYGAVRTEIDGITFASKREAKRYGELRLLERDGQIAGLELQPRYPLKVNGKLVTTYVADFRFREHGALVVEDAKGMRTQAYIIKAKLFAAIHGFQIREV